MTLSLAQARAIIDAALAKARADGAQPLAVIILDAGAHPVAFAREDGASLFRFDIAKAKASGALGMGADTRVLATRAASNATRLIVASSRDGGSSWRFQPCSSLSARLRSRRRRRLSCLFRARSRLIQASWASWRSGRSPHQPDARPECLLDGEQAV